jgi:hypothetical protein
LEEDADILKDVPPVIHYFNRAMPVPVRMKPVKVRYPGVGICGLSCRLCPHFHTAGPSRCSGCKTESRMSAGCPFITCALKRKGIEFCWDCEDSGTCERWARHREAGKRADSFRCYQKLEDDIEFIRKNGIDAFEEAQKIRESLLVEMLEEFNEGRSKSYYCIAATVMETGELEGALAQARKDSAGRNRQGRSRALHTVLDASAERKGYLLKLRK